MKKNSFLITLLAVIFHLSFSTPSDSAEHKQRPDRHQRDRGVQKLRVSSTNKKIRKLPPNHRQKGRYLEPRRVSVRPMAKKVGRQSLKYRQQGHWELKKVWVPPTPNYRKVRVPGYYGRFGKGVIGHWIRIVDRPGYWTKTYVWVSNW